MIRIIVPALFFFLVQLNHTKGQNYFYNARYYEPNLLLKAGMGWGAMLALTDLGGHKGQNRPFLWDANLECTHLCALFFAEVDFQKGWSLRWQYTGGTVSGADSLAGNGDRYAQLRNWRNLHFLTKIRETALLLKWAPIVFSKINGSGGAGELYVELGIGLFHFAPSAFDGNHLIALAPLHTEGQYLRDGKKSTRYPLTQANLPLGLGLQLDCNARWQLNLEVQYRILFTDYLDDVSTEYPGKEYLEKYLGGESLRTTLYWSDRRKKMERPGAYNSTTNRGNPRRNDGYGTLTAQLVYVINRKKR
jgi:hypothetical protein